MLFPVALSLFVLFNIATDASAQMKHFTKHYIAKGNMSVLVLDVLGMKTTDGAELAVMNSSKVIGGAMPIGGTPPWGTPVWETDNPGGAPDGFLKGDSMYFVVWDPVEQVERVAVIDSLFRGYPKFEVDGFIVVRLKVADLPPAKAKDSSSSIEPKSHNYANPGTKRGKLDALMGVPLNSWVKIILSESE